MLILGEVLKKGSLHKIAFVQRLLVFVLLTNLLVHLKHTFQTQP
jgi:hypothetical protein